MNNDNPSQDPETTNTQTTTITVELTLPPVGTRVARDGVTLGVYVGNLGMLAGLGLFTDILGFDHTVQILRGLWVSNWISTPLNILILLGCVLTVNRFRQKHNL